MTRSTQQTPSKDAQRQAPDPRKRRKLDGNADEDPAKIPHRIERSFTLANPDTASLTNGDRPSQNETEAWARPTHPENGSLRVLDAYPVVPDLYALPEHGSFLITKFVSNPSSGMTKYDTRINSAILRPVTPEPEIQEAYEARQAAYEKNKTLPKPGNPWFEYDLYLADDVRAAESIRQTFQGAVRGDLSTTAEEDGENDEDDDDDDAPVPDQDSRVQYSYVRRYETYQQTLDNKSPYQDTLVLALHDPAGDTTKTTTLQKAAYIYPIGQRTYMRPSRVATGTRGKRRTQAPKADVLDVAVREASRKEKTAWRGIRAGLEREGGQDEGSG